METEEAAAVACTDAGTQTVATAASGSAAGAGEQQSAAAAPTAVVYHDEAKSQLFRDLEVAYTGAKTTAHKLQARVEHEQQQREELQDKLEAVMQELQLAREQLAAEDARHASTAAPPPPPSPPTPAPSPAHVKEVEQLKSEVLRLQTERQQIDKEFSTFTAWGDSVRTWASHSHTHTHANCLCQ